MPLPTIKSVLSVGARTAKYARKLLVVQQRAVDCSRIGSAIKTGLWLERLVFLSSELNRAF